MATANHVAHPARYGAPPPNGSYNDRRLPPIRDLGFQYKSPQTQQELSPVPNGVPVERSSVAHEPPRHPQSWGRNNPAPPPLPSQHHPQQQATPPLSAGHEIPSSKMVGYAPKHDAGGYLTPGVPLSAQMTPIPGSITTVPGTRGDDTPHMQGQPKRSRTSSSSVPRDVRPPHQPSYSPSQYPPYPSPQPPPNNLYQQQVPSGPPPVPHSPHEQMHHHHSPVSAHPAYAGYQQQYMQPRPVPHQQPPPHQPQPSHPNPYPSPVLAPHQSPVTPPHSTWEHQHFGQHPQHTHPGPPAPAHPPPLAPHPQQSPVPSTHPQHQSHVPPPQPQPQPQPEHHQHQHHQHPTQPHPQPQHHQPHLQPQHHQPHPQPQHHQQHQHPPVPFRSSSLIPPPVDSHPSYTSSEPERLSPPESTMSEIVKLCSMLYSFASRYAQLQASLPHVQPTETELAEMAHRANHVVRLLEELRRMTVPEGAKPDNVTAGTVNSADDHRPPKRPWEDMAKDGSGADGQGGGGFNEFLAVDKPQSQTTAEQDMEIIRSKRATTAAGAASTAGQPKSKYRKRSSGQRASPPGKCHSCNIRETPEWRRGPDGARTLCNACGLHYAKLMRKRIQLNGPGAHIDMETLRASARADQDKSNSRKGSQSSTKDALSPVDMTGQQHHQGSFQLVTIAPPETSSSPDSDASRMQAHQHILAPASTNPNTTPRHLWSTQSPTTSNHGYSDPVQHQSFIRTSQQTAPGLTSPR